VPSVRKITPSYPTRLIFADEFRRRRNYTNWRPAGSGDNLLIYTAGGAGRFVSPAGAHETSEGEAVLYRPGDFQDYSTAKAPGKWHLLWAHFAERPHWHALLRWPMPADGVRRLRLPNGEIREKFHSALAQAIHLSHRQFSGALDLAANALEEALLWAQISALQDHRLDVDPRVRRAIEHLSVRQEGAFCLKELARHSGLSVSRLACLFKRETGFSPQQFWERARLQRAGQLLRLTGLTVSEVAHEVGFKDPFYFSNRFRRMFGKSPSAFRQEASQDD
jgi:AraC family transcriptional regulator of arabinose operon